MTQPTTLHAVICDAIRSRAWSEGGLAGVFLNRHREILLIVEIGEGTRHVDELFLRHLVDVVTDVGVADVVFAVMRTSGRPSRIDKLLWRELSERLAGTTTRLHDVIVVGENRSCSAATNRAHSSALTAADAQ
ncbi:MAG TPA: JAB domain-containing protein [Mycobacteriales bacterium]|jgi:DNA repair protein RadC|nr:JAB domain-containing protein [Mycobacteriales bacterium]